MQPVSTQGTDRKVKTVHGIFPVGPNQQILPALPKFCYRVVGFQITTTAPADVFVYHGPAQADDKMIATAGSLLAGTPKDLMPGDWAPQAGIANEPVSVDVSAGAADVTLFYVEIQALP